MAIIYPDMYRHTGKDHTGMMTDPRVVNVNKPERIFSVVAGAYLFYNGVKSLTKDPVASIAKLVAGGWLFVRGASGHCPVYQATGVYGIKPESINIRQNFIVNKPRSEVFQFWRQLENLPLFMKHLIAVEQISPKRSKWKAKFNSYLPPVSWDAEIVKERENKFIGWNTINGAVIENAGKIEFMDTADGSGTEVQIVFSYHAPIGGVTDNIARLFTPSIEAIIREDVNNFKHFIETKEVPEREEPNQATSSI